MFNKRIILYFKKDTLIAGNYAGTKPKVLSLPFGDTEVLPLFQKVKKVYSPKSVRIILGEEQSYFLTIKLPEGKQTKADIMLESSTIIPEELTDSNFDYKVISSMKNGVVVQVFVVPLKLLEKISEASAKTGIEVEIITSLAY